MNLYKKNMLKHVMPMNPRRHHKYLYIDANGNYVYPEDVAKKAGNKARDLNSQGQVNAVNMRKERAERIKAGNNRMAAKLKGVYDQGQANNVNARKARAESINAGNERIANSKAYKIGKTILGESKAGKAIKKIGKSGTVVGKELSKVTIPEGQRAKQKSKEEIAREDAELERRVSEGIEEFGRQQAEKYYKEQAKKKAEQLPEGWVRDQNGYVYDDIRAMAVDPNDPRLKKKKKRAKKNVAKVVKTSVAHSDTYRSNVMNSHQRMIYSSQLQHAERRNHKYLYKIGDRYVYPEDISRGIKKKAQKIINGPKTYKKDREFMKEPGNSINGVNKEEDQIGSAHTGSFIKKKTPDSGYQWADRREYEEAAERRVRSGKDYSNQIERENANKEASRKTNQKRKLRDIRARKISKSIENRNRENEQARYFDEEADRKRRKRALQHGLEWKRHKYLYKDANGNYVYPDDVKGKGHSSGSQGFGNQKLRRNLKDSLGYGWGKGPSERANKDAQKDEYNTSLNLGNRAKMLAKAGVKENNYDKLQSSKSYMRRAYRYRNMGTGKKSDTDEYINSKKLDRNYGPQMHKSFEDNLDGKGEGYVAKIGRRANSKHAAENERRDRRSAIDREVEENKKLREQKRQAEYKKEWNEKWQEERRKSNSQDQQRKSAHAGYEEDKKNFPDGGSTEELERQKRKTKARKTDQQRKSAHAGYEDWKKENDMSYREYLEKMADPEYAKKEASKTKRGIFTDTTKELERQKRKTALRKRHKK